MQPDGAREPVSEHEQAPGESAHARCGQPPMAAVPRSAWCPRSPRLEMRVQRSRRASSTAFWRGRASSREVSRSNSSVAIAGVDERPSDRPVALSESSLILSRARTLPLLSHLSVSFSSPYSYNSPARAISISLRRRIRPDAAALFCLHAPLRQRLRSRLLVAYRSASRAIYLFVLILSVFLFISTPLPTSLLSFPLSHYLVHLLPERPVAFSGASTSTARITLAAPRSLI